MIDISHISSQPGVYKMLDAHGDVLYVGKALNLKKRVSSYFSKTIYSPKTSALVSQIASVDVTVTRTETEALILESAWIKLHRPKYNILMRDDKSYPYIYISEHPVFPNISVVRRKQKPNSGQYFGPYPNVIAVRETMNLIHKLFKIRNCSDVYFNARSRPCLQFQIKRCSAPCTHFIAAENYQQAIQDAKRFLQGKSQQIIADMEIRMQQAVETLAFEEAAFIRDQIKHLRTVQEQQHIAQSNHDADIVVLVAQLGFACVQLVRIREGNIVSSEHFFPSVPVEGLDDLDDDTLWQQVFTSFLTHIYFDMPERIPDMIITDKQIIDKEILEGALSKLRGKKCHIKIGQRGLPARWLAFAQNNLQQAMVKYHTSADTMQIRMTELAKFLHIPHAINRIDCFDVSHFQGDATVASCVVFDAQGPAKRHYRLFNISGVTPGDDYAAMEQVLIRRYQGLNKVFPDVLMIDGGLGQVAVAQRVLNMLEIHHVVILGVAKGPSRKAGYERLIVTTSQDEQILSEQSPARHLIQHIRDEAHRFAITAHRKKRDKRSLSNSIETVPGIGSKRRKALLQRFGGLRELSKASLDELMKVTGISQDLAQKIYEHFHQ